MSWNLIFCLWLSWRGLDYCSTVAALARWPLIGQFVAQGIQGMEPITEANDIYIWLKSDKEKFGRG